MAAPRLPFLWPFLYRTTANISTPAARSVQTTVRRRALHSASAKDQQQVAQRYGSANEPPPHLDGAKGLGTPAAKDRSPKQTQQPKPLPKIGEKLQRHGEQEARSESKEQSDETKQDRMVSAKAKDSTPSLTQSQRAIRDDAMMDSTESIPLREPPGPPARPPDKPVEALLTDVPDTSAKSTYHTNGDSSTTSSQTPGETSGDTADANTGSATIDPHSEEHSSRFQEEHAPALSHPPHIEPSRYVHHFDTYGLVKRLTDAGWDQKQAVTKMKVMRLILAENMDLAKEALVSKSMVENESYLFKAACSELRTEVNARRKAEQEALRTARTQLQHEVEILSQRVGQEAAGLKDELKGMFDDRKLAIRSEQRDMESKIQQLNYAITVSLQADAKSDVEGLRWVMTRRVIVALGTVVFMVVGALKVFANMSHEAELEAKRQAKMRSGWTQTGDGDGGSGSGFVGSRVESADAVAGGEMLVKEGDNPAFVSLG